jgi:hypothetical protein
MNAAQRRPVIRLLQLIAYHGGKGSARVSVTVYERMIAEGLATPVPGRGYVVTRRGWDLLAEHDPSYVPPVLRA